jgi:Putative transmembrane family 234
MLTDIASLLLVGALWGCTNPFLRKGALSEETKQPTYAQASNSSKRNIDIYIKQLLKFRSIEVWLPYVLNQTGSIAFYYLLSNSNLSIAVPCCNALALAFSVGTSWLMREHSTVNHPIRSVIGSVAVMVGVMVCVHSSQK